MSAESSGKKTKVIAIIPTAGTGERFGALLPKPLVELCGKPVIAHTVGVFERCQAVDGIILIVNRDYRDQYSAIVAAERFRKVIAIVDGGATRTRSVRNGLAALPSDAGHVMVHDGVRPLVTAGIIEEGLRLARQCPAVVAAVPVKPTLKLIDPATMMVCETLDRARVWAIQTPQIFERDVLDRAYAGTDEATDDAALVEKCGIPVKVYLADYRNIKITTPEDLIIAEAFLNAETDAGGGGAAE